LDAADLSRANMNRPQT